MLHTASREASIEPAAITVSWGERAWYVALVISTIVHLTAILVANVVSTASPQAENDNAVESQWAPHEIKTELTAFEPVGGVPVIEIDSSPGGSVPTPIDMPTETATVRQLPAVTLKDTPDSLAGWFAELSHRDDLARIVGPVTSGTARNKGSGSGAGNGTGDGSGAGGQFFETQVEGRRFVFVVDCSRSMNHPYPGEYKTRFNRVKMEIGRSIVQMNAESEFFIIFFNDKAQPMPAQSFQPAQSDARSKYFQWLATVPADGMTDPRPALRMALGMRPDVIYLLTDGEFTGGIARDLETLVQREVAIHTFSLSNPDAEPTLKAVAEHNGGQYTFVP